MRAAIGSRQRKVRSRITRLQLDANFGRLRGHVENSDRGGRRRGRDTPQLRKQIQARPPVEYAILMKGVQHMCETRRMIFRTRLHSPILRISLLLVAVAATTACNKLGLGDNGTSTGPSGPPAAGSAVFYTAVGASDANGVGSSAECLFLTDCPNGMGYVPVTVRALKTQGFTVTNLNLGIPTTVIGRDFQSLGDKYNRLIVGNMIENEMPFVQTNATVVTIFAGVNEVNTITAALGGEGGSDPNGFIDAQVRAFANDYTTLLAGIRVRAGSTRIVILNVPNPAGLPFLAGTSLAQRQAAQRAAVGMTKTAVNALVSSSVTVVDLMCDARSYVASNYAGDGLHPNDAGYAFISSEVVKAITSGSYPAPQSNCSGMTIVP
jgi:lysophospholipase L1-like esterase